MTPPTMTMSATELESPSTGTYVAFSTPKTETLHREDVAANIEPASFAPEVEEEKEAPTTAARSFDFSSEPLPAPPVFDDKYKEREYLKRRLTSAFRVFAKLGFDCGIAGHITLRVSLLARIVK